NRDTARVRELLERHRPRPGDAAPDDLRGFEWYYLWRMNTSTGAALRRHPAPVTAVAFTPDSKTVVSACGDGTARIWSTRVEGQPIALVEVSSIGTRVEIRCIAIAVDGKTVVTS